MILEDAKNLSIDLKSQVQDAQDDIDLKSNEINDITAKIRIAKAEFLETTKVVRSSTYIYTTAGILYNGDDSDRAITERDIALNELDSSNTILTASNLKLSNASDKVSNALTKKNSDQGIANDAIEDMNDLLVIKNDKKTILDQKEEDALATESINVENYTFSDDEYGTEEKTREITLQNVSTTIGDITVDNLTNVYIEYNTLSVFDTEQVHRRMLK